MNILLYVNNNVACNYDDNVSNYYKRMMDIAYSNSN